MRDWVFGLIGFLFLVSLAVYLVWTKSVDLRLPQWGGGITRYFKELSFSLSPPPPGPSFGSLLDLREPAEPVTSREPQGSPDTFISEESYLISQIPEGFTKKDISPYFKKVTIGGFLPGSVTFGSYGQVSLYPNLEQGQSVNITGWYLRSIRGTLYIPKAVRVYDPSGLTPETDIIIRDGEIVQIFTTTSPIGVNLRLNRCMGYLAETNQFTPPLFTNCPYFDRREVRHLSARCQDYVLSLGGCRLPDSSPPIAPDDYECQRFLDTVNYRGCFERHRSDPDFLEREWRVWTGSHFANERHDRIYLFDREGKLVDYYEY